VIVDAQAHGTGSEQELLVPVVQAIGALLAPRALVLADAGYHSKANLVALADLGVQALVADNGMRQRDERFAGQAQHKAKPDPLHDKGAKPKKPRLYRPVDFVHDPVAGTCVCPAGKAPYRNGAHCTIGGRPAVSFTAPQSACVPCSQRDRCLRSPQRTKVRQVAFFKPKPKSRADAIVEAMKARIDSPAGRTQYGQRFGIVEPVFGNLRHNKRLGRFTLRGRENVDAQWKLFCLVHNIEKLAHNGYGTG
jgi:hypothetical protein